jgi:hypothetical protein
MAQDGTLVRCYQCDWRGNSTKEANKHAAECGHKDMGITLVWASGRVGNFTPYIPTRAR